MEYKKISVTIEVAKPAKEVFSCICEVSKWWVKDVRGSSKKVNDVFSYCNDHHYANHKLIEVVPDSKVVWLVTDSDVNYLKDRNEWTGTKMIFEINPNGEKTEVHFTHEGLDPGKESYADTQFGWNIFIGERLFNFITKGETI